MWAGSYRLRPSKITGVLNVLLMKSKSGLRNSRHSVTMANAVGAVQGLGAGPCTA